MLGLLVKQIAISPISSPRQTRIAILWHTGATTELIVNRPTTKEKLQTPKEIVDAVRELACGRTDAQIADLLNQKGFLTSRNHKFSKNSVNWIRWKYNISKTTATPGIRDDGYYSTTALAEKLGVSIQKIHYWRQKGIIEAHQESARGAEVVSGDPRNFEHSTQQNSSCVGSI